MKLLNNNLQKFMIKRSYVSKIFRKTEKILDLLVIIIDDNSNKSKFLKYIY